MRQEATRQLDRIDLLKPGQGQLDAHLFGRGDLTSGQIGGALDYGHRISDEWSAFANAEIGYGYGQDHGLMWQALTGVRWRGR